MYLLHLQPEGLAGLFQRLHELLPKRRRQNLIHVTDICTKVSISTILSHIQEVLPDA